MRALGSFSACSPGARLHMEPGATGDAHLPRPQRCLWCLVCRVSCNPSRVGFGARGRRLGGAGGFVMKLSPSRLGAKTGRRDSAPGSPVGGARHPELQDGKGAESWVFAGKMRLSVQLAYKVPVLGPHFLHSPRMPRPAPSWSSCAPAGPGGCQYGLGKSLCFRKEISTHLRVSRHPPGRFGTSLW